MNWREDRELLYESIACAVLYAPDEFPYEDYLPPDEQMTLDRMFAELREGLDKVGSGVGPSPTITTCRAMLDEAYTHYREGRTNPGAWKLQEMQELLEKL
jgi:hypothetical protein